MKNNPLPNKMTLQAYLEWINAQEPKTDFPLWKAMDMAKYLTERLNEGKDKEVEEAIEAVEEILSDDEPFKYSLKDSWVRKNLQILVNSAKGII